MERRLTRRAPAARGRAPRRRRDRLPRARHRRRPGRPRLPARLTARDRHLPATGRPRRAPSRRRARRGASSPAPATSSSSASPSSARYAPGDLDAVHPPVAPLDILAQQIVAECAAAGERGHRRGELAALVRGAAPYATLDATRTSTPVARPRHRRGRHRAGTRGRARPARPGQRGAPAPAGRRLAAATSGGAIPELADYRVVLEPEETRRRHGARGLRRRGDGRRRLPPRQHLVADAPGRTGHGPRRRRRRRRADAPLLARRGAGAHRGARRGGLPAARRSSTTALDRRRAARGAVAALDDVGGVDGRPRPRGRRLPRRRPHRARRAARRKTQLVFERFFDDTGGMQLVVHSPVRRRGSTGPRPRAAQALLPRPSTSSCRPRRTTTPSCSRLGPQHSFPLEEVGALPRPRRPSEEVLVQAVLPTPIFTSRWRWNLVALARLAALSRGRATSRRRSSGWRPTT